MERHNSLPNFAKRASRRFTTIEGWKNAGGSVYNAAGAGLRVLAIDPEFDSARYFDDYPQTSRRARSDRSSRSTASPSHHNSIDSVSMASSWGPVGLERGDHIRWDASSAHENLPSKERPMPAEKDVPPYHVFSKRQKWLLVIVIGVAGLFSGLSSNIYFPSLDAIAGDLHVSLADVSLTITSYLIAQGIITPVIWGSFADVLGRRPIYIASFTVYIIANIGLSFSPNFAVLLIFGAPQAAGSASTVSLGNGVMQDIAPLSERGGFISFYQAIRNFSIAIRPVLGGAISNYFGFRAIFIVLLVLSSVVLVVIIAFLPETLRSIAGNGSPQLGGIHQPLVRLVTGPKHLEEPEEAILRKLLAQRDILFNLIFGGAYTAWGMVTASMTGLFKSIFGLSALQIGLAFLPNGLGTIFRSAIVAKLMTRDFKTAEFEYKILHNLPSEYKLPPKNIPADFHIEHIRLRHVPSIGLLFTVSLSLYGLSLAFPSLLSLKGWLAVPLSLQFLIAAASNAVFALNQTITSDLCPGKGASSSAINNLVRCGLSALGVAGVDGLLATFGPAATFLGLALMIVACVSLNVVNWYWGPIWRARRESKNIESSGKI